MHPEPSLPRTLTPPPMPNENELTLEELGEPSIELGTLYT